MRRLGRLRVGPRFAYAVPAYIFLIILIIINGVVDTGFFQPGALSQLLAGAAPVTILTLAVTIPILSGGGGIDLSVGPLLGLINVTIVVAAMHGVTSPLVILPMALGMGIASGLLNGGLVALLRIQPIVATLGTYLVYGALTVTVLPGDRGGSAPSWFGPLAQQIGPIPGALVPLGCVIGLWVALQGLPYRRYLYAVGDNEAVAFASGVPVAGVKIGAYVLCGLCTAVGAIAMTALIGSGDALIGTPLTLSAIAGAALGGTSLGGGRGGMVGAIAGGLTVYLIQNTITVTHVSDFYVTFAYGAILVAGIALNGLFMATGMARGRA